VRKARIYADTSVIGGCFDPEFAIWSNALIGDFRNGYFSLVLSSVIGTEVERAPENVRELYAELLPLAQILPVTDEALDLLKAYGSHGILGLQLRNDMLHIALATVAGVDVLVSWNFRHIVRLDKIQQFNGVSMELGYKPLAIYSPREVTTHGKENSDQRPLKWCDPSADDLAKVLEGRSNAEIIAFFTKGGEAAQRDAERRQAKRAGRPAPSESEFR